MTATRLGPRPRPLVFRPGLASVPTSLVTALAMLLERDRLDGLLASLLTVIAPHVGDQAEPPTGRVYVDVALVGQLSRLLRQGGGAQLLPAILDATAPYLLGEGEVVPAPDGTEPLSPRELQVLRLMAYGWSNIRIGSEMYLTADTVKTHAKKLFDKLGADGRANAVHVGWQLGYLGKPAVERAS